MSRKKRKFQRVYATVLIIYLSLFLFPYEAYAYYSSDMSTVTDTIGDELFDTRDIERVSWVGDQTNKLIYMEVERVSAGYKADWSFTVKFNSPERAINANIFYNGKNRTVSVSLRDASTNVYIWGSSGKWTDDYGKSVYFSIPYKYIVGTITAGYSFDFYVASGNDRAPDSTVITVSTIPVFPEYYNIGLIAIPLGAWFVYKKRRKQCT